MKRKKIVAIISLIFIIVLAFLVYKNVSIEKSQNDEY